MSDYLDNGKAFSYNVRKARSCRFSDAGKVEARKMSGYLEYNQKRWNEVSRKKANPYTIPISHEDYVKQKEGPIRVVLTIGKTVPEENMKNCGKKRRSFGLTVSKKRTGRHRIVCLWTAFRISGSMPLRRRVGMLQPDFANGA